MLKIARLIFSLPFLILVVVAWAYMQFNNSPAVDAVETTYDAAAYFYQWLAGIVSGDTPGGFTR